MKLSHTLKNPDGSSQPRHPPSHPVSKKSHQYPYPTPNSISISNYSSNSNSNCITGLDHAYSQSSLNKAKHTSAVSEVTRFGPPHGHSRTASYGKEGAVGTMGASMVKLCPYENSFVYKEANDRINQFCSVIGINGNSSANNSAGNIRAFDNVELSGYNTMKKSNIFRVEPQKSQQLTKQSQKYLQPEYTNSSKQLTSQFPCLNPSTQTRSNTNLQPYPGHSNNSNPPSSPSIPPPIPTSTSSSLSNLNSNPNLKQQILKQLETMLYEYKIQSANSLKEAIIKVDENVKRECLGLLTRQFVGLGYLEESERRFSDIEDRLLSVERAKNNGNVKEMTKVPADSQNMNNTQNLKQQLTGLIKKSKSMETQIKNLSQRLYQQTQQVLVYKNKLIGQQLLITQQIRMQLSLICTQTQKSAQKLQETLRSQIQSQRNALNQQFQPRFEQISQSLSQLSLSIQNQLKNNKQKQKQAQKQKQKQKYVQKKDIENLRKQFVQIVDLAINGLKEELIVGGKKTGVTDEPNCNSMVLMKRPNSLSVNIAQNTSYITNQAHHPSKNKAKIKLTSISHSKTIAQQNQYPIASENSNQQQRMKIQQKFSIQGNNPFQPQPQPTPAIKSNKSLTFSMSSMGDLNLPSLANLALSTSMRNPDPNANANQNSETTLATSLKSIKSTKYIIDTDNYLMDDSGNYILDDQGKQIRLTEEQMGMLRCSNVVRYNEGN